MVFLSKYGKDIKINDLSKKLNIDFKVIQEAIKYWEDIGEINKKNTGLILEGGAMRGMFTAGVMDVLMENNIRFDGAIGVSAGAAFGVNYKSGQIGRVLRYNVKYVRDKRYCGTRVLLKTGNIFNTEFCYGEVPLKLDPFDFDAYEKDPQAS